MLPGLAVARDLVDRGHPAGSIHFVGSRRGIESRLVPEAGFGLTLLSGRGFDRRLSGESLRAAAGLSWALARAVVLVARRRPSVVVALGGYASVPCAVAGFLTGVPVVVMEQNAVPGAANRLIARFARAAATSYEGTGLPRAQVTGNPVRAEILAVDRAEGRAPARAALGLPADRMVVAVFGGSLGARTLNEAVRGALDWWKDRTDLAVRHVVGDRDWRPLDGAPADLAVGGLVYQPVRYEDRMDLLMAAADLAVCRAGATSVAELAVVGLPAVLVPYPSAPGDHQTANARMLESAGAALLVPDAQLDASRLAAAVDGLLAAPDRLAAMSAAARRQARPDAAARVADLVEAEAR